MIELSLPGEFKPDKFDLSRLSTRELKILRRWVVGDYSEHDKHVVESICQNLELEY
jgi:hypothetical protein